jgi:hypothetical protein
MKKKHNFKGACRHIFVMHRSQRMLISELNQNLLTHRHRKKHTHIYKYMHKYTILGVTPVT